VHLTYLRQSLRPTARFALAPAEAPADLGAAYAGILKLMEAGPGGWAGWKLGGSNHATRAAFDVHQPYFGPLHVSELMQTPRAAPGRPLCELQGEVEIALRINPDGDGYDAWCVALEMPASALTNLPAAGVAALVADRCGAGALLLGPLREAPLPDLSVARFRLCRGDATLSEAGIDALSGAPAALLGEFVDLARGLGFAPEPGDWVATGGITACCALAAGETITVWRDDTPELEFRVETGG
jgi:2-keto-4-pentenoate hydratase